MSRRNNIPPSTHSNGHLQTQVAHVAARLMAEDGITDYVHAKRKALRQLGLAHNHPVPPNSEVQEALKQHLALYQTDEQPGRLRDLRQEAVRLMLFFADYRPYLVGSVLDGTAGRHSDIDIQLFADSAKDVEIFLLDKKIEFSHGQPRHDRAEAVFVLETDVGKANLIVYPQAEERVSYRGRDGRPRERARLDSVKTLLIA